MAVVLLTTATNGTFRGPEHIRERGRERDADTDSRLHLCVQAIRHVLLETVLASFGQRMHSTAEGNQNSV